MFENLKKDLKDYDFWKLVLAAVLYVAGTQWKGLMPVCDSLALVLGVHTVMPA